MVELAVRAALGRSGTYSCRAPWTTFQVDDETATMLGLDGGRSLTVEQIDAARADDEQVCYDCAIAETVRSGESLVVTNTRRRPTDGAVRTLVTVTDVVFDEQCRTSRLCGHVVDISEDVCADEPLASQRVVGIVPCGPALVVLLCGELDMATREQFEEAMGVVVGHGAGPVYLDARHLRFCDAHSVRVLVDTATELARRHHTVTLLNPSRIMRRVLPTVLPAGAGLPFPVRTVPGLPEPR